jgi:hypothetical protein
MPLTLLLAAVAAGQQSCQTCSPALFGSRRSSELNLKHSLRGPPELVGVSNTSEAENLM